MKELVKKIGQTAVLHAEDGLEFNVRIENVRKNWGRVDYQVKPISGYGLKWVSEGRMRDI